MLQLMGKKSCQFTNCMAWDIVVNLKCSMTWIYSTFDSQHFTLQVCSVVNLENMSHSLSYFHPCWCFIDSVCIWFTRYSPKEGLAQVYWICVCSKCWIACLLPLCNECLLCSLCLKTLNSLSISKVS